MHTATMTSMPASPAIVWSPKASPAAGADTHALEGLLGGTERGFLRFPVKAAAEEDPTLKRKRFG